MPRLRLAAPLLASALAMAACGGSGDEGVAAAPVAETTTSTAGASSAPTSSAPASGAPAVPEQLDFTAPDVRGGQVVGADFAGQDLVIWFWAPW